MDSRDTLLDDDVRRCNDEQLIAGLQQTLRKQRGMTARLVAFIAEFDARRLYCDHAHSSMFSYAVHELHMAEDEAYVRITAARTSRAYPVVLGMLARGEIHLSGIRLLSPVMTPDNHLELLDLTRFKSSRAIEQLIRERFPKPDVRNEMRKLPSRTPEETPAPALSLSLEPALEHAETLEEPGSRPNPAPSSAWTQTASLPSPASDPTSTPAASVSSSAPNPASSATVSGTSAAPSPSAMDAVPGLHAGSRAPTRVMSPLSFDRFKVQFTASKQLHDKIEQAQHLLRNQIPDGDIAQICERALDLLLAQQMKERYGVGRKTATQSKTANPNETATPKAPPPETRHIPFEIRRQVFVRDRGQCTFRSADGKRCQERGGLQFHHQEPYALGGKATLANIHLRCGCHNLLDAERDFGRAFMRRRIDEAVAKRAQNDSPRGGSTAHVPSHR